MDEDDDGNMVPLKMAYSETGVALLTPAALLAGVGDGEVNEPKMNVGPATAKVDDAVLEPNIPLPKQQQDSTAMKAPPLPPPPGLTAPPGFSNIQPPHPAQPPMGIAFGSATQQPSVGVVGGGGSVLPQAAEPGMMFETMNPFAAPATALPSFNNNFMPVNSSSSGLNQPLPPGFLNAAQGSVNNNLQQTNPAALSFFLNGVAPGMQQSLLPNQLPPSSNSFDLLATAPSMSSQEPPQDPSESILSFLFDSNHNNNDALTRSRDGGQPLYANRQGQQHPSQTTTQYGLPPTKNPFAA